MVTKVQVKVSYFVKNNWPGASFFFFFCLIVVKMHLCLFFVKQKCLKLLKVQIISIFPNLICFYVDGFLRVNFLDPGMCP